MAEIKSALVIDDDDDVLKALRFSAKMMVETIDELRSGEDIATQLCLRKYDVVLLDMNFSPGAQNGGQGLAVLDRIRRIDPAVAVVLMTAYGGVALAVEGLKRGAVDFILKPWNHDRLLACLSTAARTTMERRTESLCFDLESAERTVIRRALEHCNGNLGRAADILGLTRPTLYRRVKKHGL